MYRSLFARTSRRKVMRLMILMHAIMPWPQIHHLHTKSWTFHRWHQVTLRWPRSPRSPHRPLVRRLWNIWKWRFCQVQTEENELPGLEVIPRTWGTTVSLLDQHLSFHDNPSGCAPSPQEILNLSPAFFRQRQKIQHNPASLSSVLCNDSFRSYVVVRWTMCTLYRSNCGEGMVKSLSVSSAPQNEHMTKQHKPDVGSEDSQPLNA